MTVVLKRVKWRHIRKQTHYTHEKNIALGAATSASAKTWVCSVMRCHAHLLLQVEALNTSSIRICEKREREKKRKRERPRESENEREKHAQ